jgi:hypothetical protein
MYRVLWLLACCVVCAAQTRTRNIIFVMTDGMRWQDVFRGADPALMDKDHGGVKEVPDLKRDYWRDTPAARREALMPFLWSTVVKEGQIYGNRDAGSEASVTNPRNVSYPGYSETFCGFADERIGGNDKIFNPNITVFEWLHAKAGFRGKVAAFGAWELFPYILNAPRAGFPVNAGYDAMTAPPVTASIALINRLKRETKVWGDESFDSFTFHTALEYFKAAKPRVLYLSLGETDDWAHDGRYDLYLEAAHRADAYIKELWDTAQSMQEHRGNTTLIVSVDHGRGTENGEWQGHGARIPESKNIWMAFLGPDTPALGERKNTAPVTQNRIAATLAALLGEDYVNAVPKAGAVLPEVLGRR